MECKDNLADLMLSLENSNRYTQKCISHYIGVTIRKIDFTWLREQFGKLVTES